MYIQQIHPNSSFGGGGEGYQTLAAPLDFTSKTRGIRIKKQINKFVLAEQQI